MAPLPRVQTFSGAPSHDHKMHMQDRSPTPGALDHDHKMDRQPAGRQQETGSATMSGGSELRHQVPPSHFATMNGDGRVPRPSSATMSGGGMSSAIRLRHHGSATMCATPSRGSGWGSGSKPRSDLKRKRYVTQKELACSGARGRNPIPNLGENDMELEKNWLCSFTVEGLWF